MLKITLLILSFLITPLFNEENNLKILNFNIQGFKTKKIEKKIKLIVNQIKEYDMFFIQENWVYNQLFKDNLFNFNLIFNNKKKSTIHGSGLTIGFNNDFKILDSDEVLFSQCNGLIFNGLDCFASKGFIFSRVLYNGDIIDTYTTHLDAGTSKKDKNVRLEQLNEFKNYIYKKSENIPLIICGDFNINYSLDSLIINDFISFLDLKFSNNKLDNAIDYIFYRNSNDVNFQTINIRDDYFNELSDHKPIIIELKINK